MTRGVDGPAGSQGPSAGGSHEIDEPTSKANPDQSDSFSKLMRKREGSEQSQGGEQNTGSGGDEEGEVSELPRPFRTGKPGSGAPGVSAEGAKRSLGQEGEPETVAGKDLKGARDGENASKSKKTLDGAPAGLAGMPFAGKFADPGGKPMAGGLSTPFDQMLPPESATDPKDASNIAAANTSLAADRILGGLAQQSQTANTQSAQAATLSRNDVVQNVQKIADQILVSKPDDMKQEVRIQLKSNVLDGAELTVRRDANGLTIKFEAKTFEAAQRIDQIAPQLQQLMQRRTNDPVNVQVDVQEDRQQSKDDEDQQGRSRNRREYGDEDEDSRD